MSEASDRFNVSSGTAETLKHLDDVRACLHRDDTKLIFLVHPNKESFCIVMEYTTADGPVAVKTTSIEEAVSFLEEEVICNELLLIFWVHALKRVKLAFQVTLKRVAGFNYSIHDLKTICI